MPGGQHLQVGDVFGEVAWDAGQLLVGTVHDGALTATLVRAHEVHEAFTAEPAAVILGAWAGPKTGVSVTGAVTRVPSIRQGWAVGVGVPVTDTRCLHFAAALWVPFHLPCPQLPIWSSSFSTPVL